MTESFWFSTNLRFVCLVENHGATRYQDSVFVFRATWFDDAFQRALELGHRQEESYLNGDGEQVAWRLKEVISLDIIHHEDLDEVEVYSEPLDVPPDEQLPFGAELHPERSSPTQSVWEPPPGTVSLR